MKSKARRGQRRGNTALATTGYGGSHRKINSSGSKILDNVKVSLLTADNWIDMAWAVLGGCFYVWVPTIIQRVGVRVNPPDANGESTYTVKWWDVNGWPMLAIGMGGGILVGAVLRQPAFMAGVIGTGVAHTWFTKLNGPIIKRVTGIYAARLDASSTSTMGDDTTGFMRITPRTLQPGATLGKVGGREVVLYNREALPPGVKLNTEAQETVNDNHQSTLEDNHQQSADEKSMSGLDANPLAAYL